MEKEKNIVQFFAKMNENTEKELDFDSFKKGWECCLDELEKQKALNKERKSGKLIIEDFINDSKSIQSALTGIYHDKGKQICSDGYSLLVHNNAGYEAELEGKIISKEGVEIECRYPNYEKVIPDFGYMKETNDFTLDDLKIISSSCKLRNKDTLKNKHYVQIADVVKLSMLIVKTVEKFWYVYPEAKLYCHEDNREENSWILKDEKTGDLLLFMPLYKKSDCNYIYDMESKIVIKK